MVCETISIKDAKLWETHFFTLFVLELEHKTVKGQMLSFAAVVSHSYMKNFDEIREEFVF